ncbi:YesL family protein [Blautia sp. HCP3S3_G3]|uniref:YesL family protein n=1 Tax=Blautia sp. HCP3S3_G3 TaxID=3438913 RepID=UPI003F8BAE5B
MDRLFNMDNKFFVFMGKIADLIILNLLCLVCCLPIVTVGASITAMFYVTLKMVRNEESYIVKSFFKSFKENFKQATIINLIMLVTALLLVLDLRIVNQLEGTVGQVLHVIFIAFMLLYLMIFLYIYPVLSKFYNSIRNTFVNAFLMSIRHLPYTILMLVISAIPIAIWFIPNTSILSTILMLFIMLGFATIAYCNSNFFVKIFDNYIPKEEDADNTENPDLLENHEEQA